MIKKLFITGTDTGIGKTTVSTALLKYFHRQGLSTLGIKPLATGASWHENRLQNQDAIELKNASSIQLPYHFINPVIFEPAIAPHIAAKQAAVTLTAEILLQKSHAALHYSADICLVEGVGGWYTPLNTDQTMADFAKLANLPVLLVVGIRLGCLNHALLTYEAVRKSAVPIIGWMANCIDPAMPAQQENIETLKQCLPIPCLGIIPYAGLTDTQPEFFDLHSVASPAENAAIAPFSNCNNKWP